MGCKNAGTDLRLTVIFSKELQLREKPSTLPMPSRQLIAGEVLSTTPESSLCISAVVTNLLEGEMVGIN